MATLIDLPGNGARHDAERDEIARNSRRFFDRYLSWRQVAAYYLHTCLTRLT